jgi:hypothetical protein
MKHGIMGALAGLAAIAPLQHSMGWHPPLTSIDRAKKNRFDPRINVHTGKPHEHKREIARRQRQAGAA